MKLGIEINAGYGSEDVHTVRKLTEAAIAQGHQVSIFLMDDGVYHAPALKDLALKSGVEITVCAHTCSQRGVQKVEGIVWGGQYDWARIVHDSDRVLVFG